MGIDARSFHGYTKTVKIVYDGYEKFVYYQLFRYSGLNV